MPTKLFPSKELQNAVYQDSAVLETVKTTLIDCTRWSLVYEFVFKEIETGKLYLTDYSTGATESQDESPFEYAAEFEECYEVELQEVTIMDYVVV